MFLLDIEKMQEHKTSAADPLLCFVSVGQDLSAGAASGDWRFPLGNAQGEKVSPLTVFLCVPGHFVMSFARLLAEVF